MISRILSQRLVCLVALFLLGIGNGPVFGAPNGSDEVLPKAMPVTKYAKMAAHSPFVPPTAPVTPQATPPPPPAPGWADSLTATMVMQDSNKFLVTVVDSGNPQHIYLSSEPDKVTQIAVASVKWGADRQDPPIITLSKGKEFATVRYEPGTGSSGGNSSPGGPPIPGGVRNPLPGVIPGGQPFRPPPLANAARENNGPSSNAIRRPLIRSQPAPVASRPGVNQPNAGVRPNPALAADDDDDD